MCGLCGIFTFDRIDPDQARSHVAAMTALMARRGPDDQGYWTDDRHLVLGFRRLSIIDVSDRANQPFTAADGGSALAFNGELYNFRELRAELERKGAIFRTQSDTEVVLEALRVWDVGALTRFNGMFALAWYDAGRSRLILARDPMGIKPLYYLRHRLGVVFGSQYDQVIRHPWCDRSRVDKEVLALYLRLNYMPAPYGILEGTGQLEPGRWVSVDTDGGWQTGTFYQRPETEPGSLLSGDDAAEAVTAGVRAAVRRQLVSDVPIGAFLSGGVDSPLVVGAMREQAEKTVPAFTIAVDDADMDESEAASTYASVFGVEHHLALYTGNEALRAVDDVIAAFSEPFADYSAFPSLAVSALARQHVKVVLSGDGGDELFWGYPRFWKVLKAAPYFRLPRLARAGFYFGTRRLPRRRPPRGVLFPTLGHWYLDAHSGLRGRQLRQICPEATRLPESFTLYELDGVPGRLQLAEWLRRNELGGHLQMVLLKMDRASMYHGLEVRVPLLDLELVRTAMAIHPDACTDDGSGKKVLRAALSRYVDPQLISRPKKGFTVPLGRWFRNELNAFTTEVLSDRSVFPEAGLDPRGAVALLDEHVRGPHDHTRGLWALLSLKLWADRHLRPLVAPASASGSG